MKMGVKRVHIGAQNGNIYCEKDLRSDYWNEIEAKCQPNLNFYEIITKQLEILLNKLTEMLNKEEIEEKEMKIHKLELEIQKNGS